MILMIFVLIDLLISNEGSPNILITRENKTGYQNIHFGADYQQNKPTSIHQYTIKIHSKLGGTLFRFVL